MSGQHLRTGHLAMRATRTLLVMGTIAAHASLVTGQGISNGKKPRADERWVPTWGTAQQLIRTATPTPTSSAAPAPAPSMTAPSPAAASQPAATQPQPAPSAGTGVQAPGGSPVSRVFRVTTLTNQTVRMILRTSI